MSDLFSMIDEAARAIAAKWPVRPRVGIILGTGLGNFAEQISADTKIPYEQIPHFPRSTAVGHKGQLVCGRLGGVPVVAMQGRFHLYEGYPAWQAALPVRVMRQLGIELFVVSNASGGLNPRYRSGDIMVMDDHINLMGQNPLVGTHDERLGPMFPDMSAPYDKALIEQAFEIARRENFAAHVGTYIALLGPNYETRAEYRLLRTIGGDAVGMSTVPEVIVAAQMGLRVLALSTITNMCLPDALRGSTGEEVVQLAKLAETKLSKIVKGVVAHEFGGAGG
jgi:purine-nucleoside phosphorylase